MAVSLYLVLKKGVNSKLEIQAVRLFVLQLILNALWSILFFGFKLPLFALFEIIVLWFIILVLIIRLYKINKTSSLLLIPYILWVSFASFLNYWIVLLN
jgi:tryptophan-rich sensory protein